MRDFIVYELLNFNYIGPVWLYRIVFGLSLISQGLLILTYLVCFCNNNTKVNHLIDKITPVLTSGIYFVYLLAINSVVFLIAPKIEIIFSLVCLAIIIIFYFVVLGTFLMVGEMYWTCESE